MGLVNEFAYRTIKTQDVFQVVCGRDAGDQYFVDSYHRDLPQRAVVQLHPVGDQLFGSSRLRRLCSRHFRGPSQRGGLLKGRFRE